MKGGIQNPEFRIQNAKAETRIYRFCFSFLLDSGF